MVPELADLIPGVHDVESSPAPRTLRGPASTWNNRAGQSAGLRASVMPPDSPSRKVGATMRATVMYGAGDVRVENVPDAQLAEH